MSEMFSYVAKQPILDADKNTVGYELLYRNGLTNAYPKEITAEAATATLITQQFIDNKISSLVGDKLCFINFPYPLFVHNIIDFLPVDQVVIEVLEDCVPNDALFEHIKSLKSKGFRIALIRCQSSGATFPSTPGSRIFHFWPRKSKLPRISTPHSKSAARFIRDTSSQNQ